MIRVICDRCGVEMRNESRLGYISWNYREGADGELKADNPLEACHFCPVCMEDIMEYIMDPRKIPEEDPFEGDLTRVRRPIRKRTGKKEENEEEGETVTGISGKRVRIDAGTMWALKKAGWSVPKIADDIGIETQEARNWFRRHKDEESDKAYRPSQK